MDVRKTMEFILEQQAQAAVWKAEIDARQAKTERRLEAITKLIQTGMKMLVKQEQQKETGQKLSALSDKFSELTEAQHKTDLKLNRVLDALSRGTNGTNGKKH